MRRSVLKRLPILLAVLFLLHGMGVTAESYYTYETMEEELTSLSKEYASRTKLGSLGETVDGRNVYCLRIGEKNASHSVLIFGAIHAREYLTSELVMLQSRDFLAHLADGDSYSGYDYEELLSDTALYVIPMLNPDGVAISQFGLEGIQTEEIKEKILQISAMDGASDLDSYLRLWKSNAEGIDLNRQFYAGWDEYDDGVGHPSADHYKGEEPVCTVEANILAGLTERLNFERAIAYHTQGSVIYWDTALEGEIKEVLRSFATAISNCTGYTMMGNESLDEAGYRDWATKESKVPCITIEVGYGDIVLPRSDLAQIAAENRYVWEETLINRIEWNN